MKIYLGGAVSSGRKYFPQLKLIEETLKQLGHQVVGGALKREIVPGENLDPKALYQREMMMVEEAEAMIAEVSQSSWGTAFLMAHALKKGKPVLALYYKQRRKNGLPVMIKGHPDLYNQFYIQETIKSILDHQLKFFQGLKRKEGFFIALEGVDGSGKTTQVEKLVQSLKNKNLKVRQIDFPRYYTSFHGEIITRLLQGEFGAMNEVSPYLASLAYALDRLTARKQIREWLESGYVVVANRYTGSNMAHQAAKLPKRQQLKFIRWVDEMEYRLHKIPREDLTIFLDVPIEISQQLLASRRKRAYLRTVKKDIAERDLQHQQNAYEAYLRLCRLYPHWKRLKCVNNQSEILSADKVQAKIMKLVEKNLA